MLPQEKINCCFLFLFLDNKPLGTLKKNNKKTAFSILHCLLVDLQRTNGSNVLVHLSVLFHFPAPPVAPSQTVCREDANLFKVGQTYLL